jgi:tetratricopeptide (TPR) repeat protein
MKPFMTNLNRLLARQNFKDGEELQAFLDNLSDKSLYDLPEVDLSPEEQVQDFVYDAYEHTPAKVKKNIEKALALDPNCIDAYEYLASIEKTIEKALEFLEKGITIGRKKFGGKYLKGNKGMFWGIHETRPFMRCLYHKAVVLVAAEKIAEGVAIMEEMLELNDHDNQGVRFQLLSALIILDETEKFKKYDKMFADDEDSTQMLYSRALFAFKTEGNSANARKMLIKAFTGNPFVVQMFFDRKLKFSGVESYSVGSPEEAEVYLMYAAFAWCNTEGALEWVADTIEDYVEKMMSKKIT